MTRKKSFEEWADQYLQGDLSREERMEFEANLEDNADLKEEFNQHRQMISDLKKIGVRKLFKQTFQEIIGVGQHDGAIQPTYKLVRMYKWTAVAASVIFISVFTTLFTANYLSQNKVTSKYNALKREVDQLKTYQNVLVSDYNNKVRQAITENFSGTGFLISNNGYLITNYHVVSSADSVFVSNYLGEVFKVEIVIASREFDLAILKILDTAFHKDQFLPYTISKNDCSLGEKLFTLGYPKEDIVYGEGYLSSRLGFMGDSISYQISMPLNPGNSGGPLFDSEANLIGVVSGKQNEREGVAFAIRSAYVLKTIEMAEETTDQKILVPHRIESIRKISRNNQVNTLEKFVFQVRVYSKNS
jgi:S1-C subfamily serine protease